MNYYNDNDKFCCQWLCNLIEAKLIPQGVVDDRSISDIRPSELREFRQLHFFAGIGGWAYALRLAGWPDDRPVITGSCPCQPFSVAGKGKGVADERHLWPAFRWLIAHLRPATVFGEQVASKAGRLWLAGVRTDLEELGYAVGAADLCAAGVSAPHKRQRLYWVGKSNSTRPFSRLETAEGTRHRSSIISASGVDTSRVVNADGYHRHWWSGPVQVGWNGVEAKIERGGREYRAQWRLKPGLSIVAHGIPGRVGLLKGAGNAIVPQVAAEFISAFMETE